MFDFHKSEERERDFFCRQGFGTILARAAQGLPVRLSTPVNEIEYSGRWAVLKTPQGTLRARAVIVTVSTSVLASGAIKFQPHLPVRHREAIDKLGLGSYDHIVLEMPGNPLELGTNDVIIEKATGRTTAALLANIHGTPLCMVDVGGNFGRGLSDQGQGAMVDFAIGWLAQLFGNNVKTAVKRRAATRWDKYQWVRGAFSAATPGGQPGRATLAESLNERIWFAGEAVSEGLWGTVAGAWQSGVETAASVINRLARP
jgi:monoamine oxidase